MPSIEFLLNFSNDDSFFYLKIAYNLSSGAGSTFDTINPTNGYHPLWLLVLTAYFFILNFFTSFTPELYFRFTIFLIFLISALTLFVIFKLFKKTEPAFAKKEIILFTPLFLTFVSIRDFGMETHITCLIVSFYIYLKTVEFADGKNLINEKCFALVLLFLTRIDFLLNVIPVIILTDYLLTPKVFRIKFISSAAVSVAAAALIYFLFNYFNFGGMLPVSGSIKNSFPEILIVKNIAALLEPATLTNQFAKTVVVTTTVAIVMLLISVASVRKKFTQTDFFIFGLCIAAFCFVLFTLLFNSFTLKEWYVAFPMFVCSLMAVRIIMLFPKLYNISLVISSALLAFMFYLTRIENPKWISNYYYAKELKKVTNENDRIYKIDFTGITGFFSERKIINGDGLVNSFEYQKSLSSGELGKFLKDESVNFYSTYTYSSGIHTLKDSADFMIDTRYSNFNYGGYPFIFPKKNLVLKAPLYFSHAANSDSGWWYLFKLEN